MAPRASSTKNPPTENRRNRLAARRAGEARAKRIKIGTIIGGIGALVAAIVLAVAAGSGAATGVADPARFDLPAMTGHGRVHLADFRGKPVVVNMFASWCTGCEQEIPSFVKQAHRLAGKVTFVEVNSSETGDGLSWAREYDLTNNPDIILAKDVGPSPASKMHDALGANGMPVSVFYDGHGNILEHDNATILEPDLGNKLQQLYGV